MHRPAPPGGASTSSEPPNLWGKPPNKYFTRSHLWEWTKPTKPQTKAARGAGGTVGPHGAAAALAAPAPGKGGPRDRRGPGRRTGAGHGSVSSVAGGGRPPLGGGGPSSVPRAPPGSRHDGAGGASGANSRGGKFRKASQQDTHGGGSMGGGGADGSQLDHYPGGHHAEESGHAASGHHHHAPHHSSHHAVHHVSKRLAKVIAKNFERISDMFRRLDKSGDGNISKAELSDGLTRVIGLDLRWVLWRCEGVEVLCVTDTSDWARPQVGVVVVCCEGGVCGGVPHTVVMVYHTVL